MYSSNLSLGNCLASSKLLTEYKKINKNKQEARQRQQHPTDSWFNAQECNGKLIGMPFMLRN